MRSQTPLAVTFDYWDTLVREDTRLREVRFRAWNDILVARGHAVSPSLLTAAFDAAWYAAVDTRHTGATFGVSEGVDVALAVLDVGRDPELACALESVISDTPASHTPTLEPGLVDALSILRSAGIRIGIVCNVGLTPAPTLRRYLTVRDVSGAFDHSSFSDEVGARKPDAAIFRHALDGLGGVRPERAVHVGDLRRIDVAGARSIGMGTVRYRGVCDDPPSDDAPLLEADAVIDTFSELPATLGVT